MLSAQHQPSVEIFLDTVGRTSQFGRSPRRSQITGRLFRQSPRSRLRGQSSIPLPCSFLLRLVVLSAVRPRSTCPRRRLSLMAPLR